MPLEEVFDLLITRRYYDTLGDEPKSITLEKIPCIDIHNAINKICIELKLLAAEHFDADSSCSDDNINFNASYDQGYRDENFLTTKTAPAWATHVVHNSK